MARRKKEEAQEEDTPENIPEDIPEENDSEENSDTFKQLPKEKNVERAVGDILRDEGIIKDDEERYREDPGQGEKISITRVLMEVEKLREVVNTLKTIKFEADERIKELAESIGEIRSLFFQRDSTIKETEKQVEELVDVVKEFKPEKFKKMIELRDQDVGKLNANIEKITTFCEDLGKRTTKSEKILEKVRSIENIEDLNKEVNDTFEKIKELKWAVERDSAKSERFFLESEKRVKEIQSMQAKVEQTEELTKEMLKDFDSTKIKMDDFITKEDFSKSLAEQLKMGIKKEERVAEKTKKKEEIEILIKNLDDQFNKKMISEGAYREITEKNAIILKNIDKEIENIGTEKEMNSINDWSKYIESAVDGLKMNTDINKKKIEQLEAEMQNSSKPERGKTRDESEKESLSEPNPFDQEIKEIKELLNTIEQQHKRGIISEKTYNEVRKRNLEKIERLGESHRIHRRRNIKIKKLKRNLRKTNRRMNKTAKKTHKKRRAGREYNTEEERNVRPLPELRY
ncbi:MAG: hypothetical protein NTX24_04960 [Candidatus Pacearchaeota archaeon]|nr:hypothetical protein [Candidatus Pacearchaeota archaeon]